MPESGVTEVGAALETTRLFIEALNARDVETLRAAVTDDVGSTRPWGATRVSVPVRELVRKGELPGTAVFEIRDGRITAFEVVPADQR